MVEMPEFGKILPFPTRDAIRGSAERGTQDGRAERIGMASTLLGAVNAYADANGGGEGYFPIPNAGLHIIRAFHEMDNHYVYQPSLCITLQGGKEILIGDETLSYGPMQCLVVGLDLPACGRIVTASPNEPFIGITVEFDIAIMREVLDKLDAPVVASTDPVRSMFVADVDGALADCVLRMVRLTETPQAIPILYPALMREFYYWLLSGPNASDLWRQAVPDTHLERIGRAIHLLRQNFSQTLRIERLAEAANMSPSSFHQHFKALTAMSPLQFQKQLRLLEAKRLLTAEAINVAEAAYQVGYESPSQFSREYSRTFGIAPKRDAMNSKAALA
ncbi:AraC family transcriptional regulator [Sphingomonas kyeonggiensis]|uniref:AraC-like DNA-binding protein n=1 Tax=Sphingomonas kyeonggiensis TaxID=1268553 RepID=A0A7W6JTQ6_9SPHN|nr:AraC family transcriptional regulator [Sphingomonas kyeonggiensis]MBB4099345.1 AraC-like DNA-binding protein [Sphingomonas kyeonggiensis]